MSKTKIRLKLASKTWNNTWRSLRKYLLWGKCCQLETYLSLFEKVVNIHGLWVKIMNFYFLYAQIKIKIAIETTRIGFGKCLNFPRMFHSITITKLISQHNILFIFYKLMWDAGYANKIKHKSPLLHSTWQVQRPIFKFIAT